MPELIGGDRPQRDCLGCGHADDHPRCQVQVSIDSWALYHPDCHHSMHGDMDCHPQCNGGARPGPGRDMLSAIMKES